jgi:ubiquinone/menaquinone biosynthesis C-methylase UbiE
MSTAATEANSIPQSSTIQNQNGNKPAKPATELPPEVLLTQMVLGSLSAQSVYVAAKLGVADLLAAGPKSATELARATRTDAASLYRVLRALASFGIFSEQEGQVFALTPSAEPLRSDSPNTLRDLAIFMGEDWHWRVWGKVLYSVRTGLPAWEQVHGQEVFPYFAANPQASLIFDRAMTSLSNLAIKAVVEAYDFSGIATLVDVAGGHGRLLTAIMRANQSLKGVLFDQVHVISGAREGIKEQGVDSRCELVSGDFFEAVPAGADGYIMKHIIHDWDDERALKILKNIRNVMKSDGRVLLVESVITNDGERDFGKLLDIEMLVSPGGKERTAAEYEDLFARAGLKLTRVVPTASPYSVVEAVAA